MKKRNILAILAALSVVLVSFAACGDKGGDGEKTEPTTSAAGATQVNGENEDVSPDTDNKIEYIEVTEVVTDTSGAPVTDANGETKVETVTKPAPTQPSSGDTSDNSGNGATTSERKLQKLAKSLAGKKSFTFDGEVSTGTESLSAKIYVKGDKVAMEANVASMAVRLIYTKDSVNMLIPSLKYYITMPVEEAGAFNTEEMIGALSNIDSEELEYVSTTTEKVDGKNYTCETYKDGVNTNKYYFDSNDNLKRIEIIDDKGNKNITKVNEFSANVSDSVFTIPAGYKELSQDDLGALAGMMGG